MNTDRTEKNPCKSVFIRVPFHQRAPTGTPTVNAPNRARSAIFQPMQSVVSQTLVVGAGGFVGAGLRFLVSGWVYQLVPNAGFPWGTLVVNVVGCLVLGLLGGLAEVRGVLSATTRLFLFIGVLGGFTTFSTLAFETIALADGSQMLRAAANVAAHVVLGLGAAWLGFNGARLL